jgi:hypothetical protein
VVLFVFRSGAKGEFRIFEEKKILIFNSFSTGTKSKMYHFFAFGTGTKSEKLNFYSSNILNSPLVPLLNTKITTFSHLVTVQRPQCKIEDQKFKKTFLGIYTPVQIPCFWS